MKTTLSTLLLAGLAAAASAADQPEPPPIFAALKPKVGAWAEYAYEGKKGDSVKSKGTFRMAVVGKQGDAYWFEQKMTPELPKPKKEGRMAAMKLLMGKDGIEKAYMKSERGVMDMSGMMAGKGRPKEQEAAGKTKMTEVGVEEVVVPAGKFKATHYTFGEAKEPSHAWIKAGAGPYGMIKQEHRKGKELVTVVLSKVGDDAKSEIDEKTAASPYAGMALERPARSKKGRESDAAAEERAPAERPSLGGLFKNALKKKAGL